MQIKVNNLSFGYMKNRRVLENVSFSVGSGEIVNVLGPNGCGKSTLIKLMLGFLSTKRGTISIDGRDICDITRAEMASLLSYVPQLHNGAFSYTVLDVVLMGRVSVSPWYKYTEDDYNIAYAALDKFNMRGYAERSYLQLSGGERQLVLIARAFAQGTEFLIMDEPVSGLDYGNQYRLLEVIKQVSKEGFTVVLTTHHPEHAIFLGGRALLIKEGTVVGDGEPEAIINSNCICNLYNMPRELVDKVNFTKYTHSADIGD